MSPFVFARHPVLVGGLLLRTIAASAQDSTAGRSGPITLDSAAVASWADSIVKPALASSGIPGAVVVVAQRDRVLLNRGYGVSDIVAKTPVTEGTLFNTASVGKSMTAIVTVQLIDEGVLNLDEDINRYLKSTRVSGPKVTLRMLLGHRGGFDDDITGLLTTFDGDIRTPRAELDRRLHPLVEPGVFTAYDNQGYGVIGLVLRDVTGKALPELYRERLFDPAGMPNAVLGRPSDGRARLARCYTVQGPEAIQECEYWLYRDAMMGAGGVAMSGADMARYLRLLLNDGNLDGRQVLSPKAFADLTNFDHYRFHPGMPGGARAFTQFEELRGLEYAHGGSIPGFSTMMKIYRGADVGIFVTFMGGQPGGFDLTVSNVFRSLRQINIQDAARPGLNAMRELTDKFADRFIPTVRPRSSESSQPPPPPATERLDDYLGRYVLTTNHSRSFMSRLAGWGGVIKLERAGTDGVRLGGIPDLGDYRPVGPLVYQNDKGERLALGKVGDIRAMAVGLSGGMFRQTNALESPFWSLPVFAIAILVLLTGLGQLRKGAVARVRRLSKAGLLGLVLVFGGLLAEWQWGITLGVMAGAIVRPALWRLAIHVGAALLLWEAITFFRARGTPIGRLSYAHGALVAAAAIAVVVVVLSWRVLGAFPPYLMW